MFLNKEASKTALHSFLAIVMNTH